MLLARFFFHVTDVKNSSSVAKDAAKRLTQLAQDDNGEYKAADMSLALDQVNTIFGTITTVVGAIAGDFTLSWWNRCYEHHVGFSNWADTRDWSS